MRALSKMDLEIYVEHDRDGIGPSSGPGGAPRQVLRLAPHRFAAGPLVASNRASRGYYRSESRAARKGELALTDLVAWRRLVGRLVFNRLKIFNTRLRATSTG